jgi:hypothetical protein
MVFPPIAYSLYHLPKSCFNGFYQLSPNSALMEKCDRRGPSPTGSDLRKEKKRDEKKPGDYHFLKNAE